MPPPRTSPVPAASPFQRRGPTLSRPWPLLPLALADLTYTLYAVASTAQPPSQPTTPTSSPPSSSPPSPSAAAPHAPWSLDLSAGPPMVFVALALARTAALLALHHPRWRQRGGWVLGLSGGTLIACVWEVCAGVLSRDGERREVEGVFLGVTAGFAVSEFLLYLLLLRLSPVRTYTLRPPPGRMPSLPLTPHVTPLPTSRRGTRDRPPLAPLFTTPIPTPVPAAEAVSPIDGLDGPPAARSYGAISIATSITDFGPATVRSPRWDWGEQLPSPAPYETDEEGDGYRTTADYYDVEAGEGGYESDDSASTSTVSDSSIIDLPPPRPLHPVTLDPGLAELAGAVEAAAGVVRRSASARFGRSVEGAEVAQGGYGTFSRS